MRIGTDVCPVSADGFESGNPSAWSAVVPASGALLRPDSALQSVVLRPVVATGERWCSRLSSAAVCWCSGRVGHGTGSC